MDVSDLLDSDQRIMGHTQVRNGMLVFDFHDGETPIRGTIDGKLDGKQIVQWCNAVRSEYRARQDRKENQGYSPKKAIPVPHEREGGSANDGGGGAVPVAEDVQGAKAALEAGIESSLVSLGRRRAEASQNLAAHLAEIGRLEQYISGLDDTIEFYTTMKRNLDASSIRTEDRLDPSRKEVEARIQTTRARKVAAGSVPTPHF